MSMFQDVSLNWLYQEGVFQFSSLFMLFLLGDPVPIVILGIHMVYARDPLYQTSNCIKIHDHAKHLHDPFPYTNTIECLLSFLQIITVLGKA